MKVLKRLCIAGYCIVLLLGGVAFFAEGICENELSKALLHRAVTEKLVTLYDKLNSLLTQDQLNALKSDAEDYSNDADLNHTAKLYIAAMKSTVSKMSVAQAGTAGAVSIKDALDNDQVTEDLNNFSNGMVQNMSAKVKDNLSSNLSDSSRQILEKAISSVFEDMKPQLAQGMKTLADEGSNNAIAKLTPMQVRMIKAYTAITSQTARIILCVLAIVFLAAIVLLNRQKAYSLMNIGGAHTVAGAVWLLVAFFANRMSGQLTSKFFGLSLKLDVTVLYWYGGILLGSGIILCILMCVVSGVLNNQKNDIYIR